MLECCISMNVQPIWTLNAGVTLVVYRNTSDTSYRHQEARQGADCTGEWGGSPGLPYSGWCYCHAPLGGAQQLGGCYHSSWAWGISKLQRCEGVDPSLLGCDVSHWPHAVWRLATWQGCYWSTGSTGLAGSSPGDTTLLAVLLIIMEAVNEIL